MARRRRRSHCPCGNSSPYAQCCAPLHRFETTADTPETLVRARYSAFVRQHIDFIVGTTDPEGEAWQEDETTWRKEIARFSRRMTFVGLSIRTSNVEETQGTVDFVVGLRHQGEDASFREQSHFRRHGDRWLYRRGTPQPASWPPST